MVCVGPVTVVQYSIILSVYEDIVSASRDIILWHLSAVSYQIIKVY